MKAYRWFERALLVVLSFGITAVIAACYGGYYMMQKLAGGKVTSGGTPVNGIEVCLYANTGGSSPEQAGCTSTDETGMYTIEGPDHAKNDILNNGGKIEVKDIDGDVNGLFKDTVVDVSPQATPLTIDIELEQVKAAEPAPQS